VDQQKPYGKLRKTRRLSREGNYVILFLTRSLFFKLKSVDLGFSGEPVTRLASASRYFGEAKSKNMKKN